MIVFRSFPNEGIVALFEEEPGGGATDDINSPRNAPAKSPILYLPKVTWHSNFFQYELAAPIQTVSVSHSSLSGQNRVWGIYGNGFYNGSDVSSVPGGFLGIVAAGAVRTTDIILYTHNLGYVPLFYVAYADRIMINGTDLQPTTSANARYVSAYATSTVVGIREISVSSTSALPAQTETYQVLVTRNPAPNPTTPLMRFDGTNLTVGRGIVDTSKDYIRTVLPSESSFDLDLGRTVDVSNGRTRYVTGGITRTDNLYNGTFLGSPYIPIGV